MSEVSRNRRTMFSFQDTPPEIAYLDPSFLLNVLVAESAYHAECVAFATQLERARNGALNIARITHCRELCMGQQSLSEDQEASAKTP